jgi:hypothetical protein
MSSRESVSPVERVGQRQFKRIGFELIQAASVVGNRGQLFLYNPPGSGVSYGILTLTTRVSANVASDAPQHFLGTDVLGDAELADVITYLDASTAVLPALRLFGRDVLSANILQGNRRLSQHIAGSNAHTQNGGYLADLLIPPGTWYAWSPPEGSGIITLEGRLIEYPS